MKERMRKWKRRRLLLLVLLGEENDDTKYNGKEDSFHIYYVQGGYVDIVCFVYFLKRLKNSNIRRFGRRTIVT